MQKEILGKDIKNAAELKYFLDKIEAEGIDLELVYVENYLGCEAVAEVIEETLTDGSKVHNLILR